MFISPHLAHGPNSGKKEVSWLYSAKKRRTVRLTQIPGLEEAVRPYKSYPQLHQLHPIYPMDETIDKKEVSWRYITKKNADWQKFLVGKGLSDPSKATHSCINFILSSPQTKLWQIGSIMTALLKKDDWQKFLVWKGCQTLQKLPPAVSTSPHLAHGPNFGSIMTVHYNKRRTDTNSWSGRGRQTP